MLQSLHVKNLALIEESEVEFTPGLNILTGETGAGKSILLGSVNLVLGAKADKDLIRSGAEYALVELVFSDESGRIKEKLKEMDLPYEEDTVMLTRKIQPARSVSRINGETVTARQLKEISELLLDIHGQHEHQSLLRKKKHLEILDAFAGEKTAALLSETAKLYQEHSRLKSEIAGQEMDAAQRKRELEILYFEKNEIEGAALSPGEDEELENRYRRMANSRKIGESAGACYRCTGGEEGAAVYIGRAVRELGVAAALDADLAGMSAQIAEIESLLNDFNRELSDYMESMEFDGSELMEVQERLNLINHLKEKYGKSIPEILEYENQLSEKIEMLENYEIHRKQQKEKYDGLESALLGKCGELSEVRKKEAEKLSERLTKALEELNFLSVEFAIHIEKKEIAPDGFDDVEFMISTNPGEPRRPLGLVASGGELSRIMLGIKTLFAAQDAVDTLIFDEIDAGISGRTAWKVSEKLGRLSGTHQVICITHLPQIAAMADTHFLIEKETDGESTVTAIHRLDDKGSLEELARLLGADELSGAALKNAQEIKKQASKIKQNEN